MENKNNQTFKKKIDKTTYVVNVKVAEDKKKTFKDCMVDIIRLERRKV